MSRGGPVSIFAGIATAACLMLAPTAGAATLTGDYQFQGTRASSGPGPTLIDVGAAGSTFGTDNVMGVSRQVLVFPLGTGLQMAPAGVGAGPYSAVITFRMPNPGFNGALTQYDRILDPFNAESERGLYAHGGRLSIYGDAEGESASVLFSPNTYATVAMVVAGLPLGAKAYFNGAPVAQLAEDFSVRNDTLRFFKDDGTEESAGAVSCIRVFSGALTDAEVAAIGANPRCGATTPVCKGKPATIIGTEGKDVRKGTSGKDVMVGLGGNDKLSGLAGNDLICGGSGKDTLNGGKGNDKLYGEAGKDTLRGAAGKDKLKGGAGKDKQIQ
jgi:Ca2+-binding RTX toxin-like protein